jgi:hypothetical protein
MALAVFVATSLSDIVQSVFEVFFFLQWQLPVLPIVCVVLGVLTARKTQRSVFNWVLIGAINGVIPVIGPILMVLAYFFYPPPAPSTKPGYHPPQTARRGPREGLPKRPRERR